MAKFKKFLLVGMGNRSNQRMFKVVHKDPMRTLLKALSTAQTDQDFEEGFERLRRLLSEGGEADIGKLFQCYVSTGSLLATQVCNLNVHILQKWSV